MRELDEECDKHGRAEALRPTAGADKRTSYSQHCGEQRIKSATPALIYEKCNGLQPASKISTGTSRLNRIDDVGAIQASGDSFPDQ